MKCFSCGKPATVHVTNVEPGGQKKELHLCQACAEKMHLFQQKQLSLPALVHALLGAHLGPAVEEISRLHCPACGIGFMEFRQQGRLGCPYDYVAFRKGLLPLLERLHRRVRHRGKVPRRCLPDTDEQRQVIRWRQELGDAITREAFEEAAVLRDRIRRKDFHL
ncbi:MAG: UvrB/UvrC motif-containing protein [Gemmatales bacterium]|nr:UvrB/UvrC motif-containing protein [Gemmatales bacterium]MCS7160698.1 UvrB/UvrC motif-containing protein [Gemmatales bacterium]MDW8175899.1 UvrB/UvrC motif-containing protein [Gemmatales bacterium]MDW8223332.1 UvrB/UvrC motif-containing protein [Gemmatales bacterium]